MVDDEESDVDVVDDEESDVDVVGNESTDVVVAGNDGSDIVIEDVTMYLGVFAVGISEKSL